MRRILVGYDDSDGARRALDRAVEEARAGRSRITVLAVIEMPLDPQAPRWFGTPDDISGSEGSEQTAPTQVVAQLTTAQDRLATAGLEAELRWAAGEPGEAIVEAARELRADVIILGEHHHGFLGSMFGADVDAEVQKRAGCEVVLA